ncbi:MAG: alpha/beta fold hydrolase [Candidatus Izemoplasmatales bacterium]
MSSIHFKGKKVFYQLEGDESKPKLLILNGIMMSTKSWQPFMESWLNHFQVLRVDFLDQGQSDKMDENYEQDIQIELLSNLLETLNIDKINVVGISYGGAVALAFAIKHQSKINRLILFNSNAYTNPLLKDIGRSWIKAGQTRDGSLYYKTTIPIIYSPSYYEKKLEWMKEREKVLTPIFSDPSFLDAMERLTLSAESFDVRDELHTLELETMIITADEDFLTPKKDQEYLAKHIKNSHWLTIPGVGHASMYENPLLFTSLITGFFLVKESNFKI